MGEKLPPRLRANSANTNPIRNAGHFTRGSQLIGHDLSMWMRGARIPPIIWGGSFILILWLKLIAILDNQSPDDRHARSCFDLGFRRS